MSAGGHISTMLASIKNNSRRKKSHIPFEKDKKNYSKSEPIISKKLTPSFRKKLLAKLKRNRKYQEKLRTYKLIISLALTVIVIGIIVFSIKAIYF